MNRPVHALVLGLTLCLAATVGQASTVENKGSPGPKVAEMTNYGLDVATRTGLKSVIPAGWQLFVHRSVALPDTMSWKLGQPWPSVLAEFAVANNVSVLIDWDGRVVMMRSPEQAIEERAKREEIDQAATTPLPLFAGALSDAEQKKLDARTKAREAEALAQAQAATVQAAKDAAPTAASAAVANAGANRSLDDMTLRDAGAVRSGGELPPANAAAPASTVSASASVPATQVAASSAGAATMAPVAVPVIRTNPTAAMVASQEQAAKAAPAAALSSTEDFRYTMPVAVNKPSARSVAQAIANRYGLRMVFATPEFHLKGPVTLLAESAEQDALLLQRAIGRFGPAVIEVSGAEKVLRVLPRAGAPVVMASANSRASGEGAALTHPVAPVAATVATTAAVLASSGASHSTAIEPGATRSDPIAPVATAQAAEAAPLSLTLNEAEPLEDALVRFTREHGYTLEWKVTGGFEANRAMTFRGNSVAQVLSAVLPTLGLSADIYTRDKHIVVRPGDAARDR